MNDKHIFLRTNIQIPDIYFDNKHLEIDDELAKIYKLTEIKLKYIKNYAIKYRTGGEKVIKTIDLFAGCGGFSCGFEQAGFNIISAVEIDAEIAQSYQWNHKKNLIVDDIKNVDNSNIFKPYTADVIIGGPPCQGFSMAGSTSFSPSKISARNMEKISHKCRFTMVLDK